MDRAIQVDALGIPLELVCDTSVPSWAVQEMLSSWADARDPRSRQPERITISVGSDSSHRSLVTVPTADQLGQVLSTVVTQRALSRNRGTHVLLHASGIALDDGRVIAFVGPSGMGKTTLARALGRDHGYVTDETVAISSSPETFGQIAPYRKPLSLVQDGAPKRQVAPGELGLQPLPESPLRIAAIVLIDRISYEDDGDASPGADEFTLEQLPLAESIALLAPHLSYLASLEQPLTVLAQLITRTGGVERLRYRDARAVLAAVEEILSPPTEANEHGGGPDEPTPETVSSGRTSSDTESSSHTRRAAPAPPPLDTPTWSAAPSIEWLDDGDTVVTLQAGQVRVLAGIAPALWRRALAAPSPGRSELLAAVLEEFGAPEGLDASELVQAAIDQLADEGLLTAR